MNAPNLNEITCTADETAAELLNDGLDFLQAFIECNGLETLPASHALLIAGFALVKQREAHYEEQRIERLGSQAFSEPGDPTDVQRAHDYDWLKCMVERACPNMGEEERREAMARITRLAGV
jgi:hypothetical protein